MPGGVEASMVKERFRLPRSSRQFPHSVIPAEAGIQSLLHDLCAITARLDTRLRGHDGFSRHLRRGF
jgi:hypothetical protein